MKRALAFAGALAATALGSFAFQPLPVAAAPQKDWSQTVVATPEGGFRMGNPAAKVKLVEYGSLTCPHCAHFSAEAKGPLTAYVKSGKVSFEFRNYVLNGIDVTATLLARCAPPSKFFALTDRLYATQSSWVGKISGLSQAEKDRLKTLPSGQRLGRLADVGGLTQLAAAAGVTPARGKQCLADEAALDRLGKMGEAAAALGVQGTPTFFLNGRMLSVNEWAQIEPLIRQAGG